MKVSGSCRRCLRGFSLVACDVKVPPRMIFGWHVGLPPLADLRGFLDLGLRGDLPVPERFALTHYQHLAVDPLLDRDLLAHGRFLNLIELLVMSDCGVVSHCADCPDTEDLVKVNSPRNRPVQVLLAHRLD